jgi:hypothetical protein
MNDENNKSALLVLWENRTDKITAAVAVVGLLLALVSFVWQSWDRTKAEASAVEMTGRFCQVLDQERSRDVLNALYESWPLMAIQKREFRNSTNVLATLRNQFCDGSEYRLFNVTIRNNKNVPVSLGGLGVRDLCIKSSNSNLFVRSMEVFAATGANGDWETDPIICLGPRETRQVDVVVSFMAVDRVEDGMTRGARPPMSVAQWRSGRFSQADFQSLRFAFRDNAGNEHLSNVIPVNDKSVAK